MRSSIQAKRGGREPSGLRQGCLGSNAALVRLVVVCVLALLGSSAWASEPGPKPKVAMTRVRGDSTWGAAILQQSLVRALAPALELVQPEAFEAIQRKATGGRGQPARLSPEGLAAAGRQAGAAYVFTVEIVKRGYLYTAHAELIETSTSAALRMDFRSGYYRPASEAADRGERIAKKTVEKIALLLAPPPPVRTSSSSAAVELAQPASSRDDEIFAEADIGDPAASSSRDDEIFGGGLAGPGGVEETERRLGDLETKVKAGGRLFMRLNYLIRDEDVAERSAISSPNLLDLYVDARLNDRVRGYAQARVTHDFSIAEGQVGAFGETQQKTRLLLDQVWAKFDIAHTVYATVGRQRIKWGTGRFWNPTDFLNAAARDPLAVFDERLGVSMVKLHLPIESLSWNFYGIVTLDDADLLKRIGGAFRAEILLGQAELTLSATMRKDAPTRLGFDLSAGLSFLDFRAEGALVYNTNRPYYRGSFAPPDRPLPTLVDRSDQWIPQAVVGVEATLKISDRDSLILGLEYFYNDAGYDDGNLYPFLLFQDSANRRACSGPDCAAPAFQPLYMGRHYGAAYLALPNPLGFSDTTVILSALSNLSDRSALARLDFQTTVLSFLSLSLFGQVHFADRGEFKLGFAVAPTAGVPGLENGASIADPIFDLGAGLSLTF